MRPIQSAAPSSRRHVSLCQFWWQVGSLLMVAGFVIALTPRLTWACACGCGVFDVGTASLFPSSAGGQVWLQWEYMDQYINFYGKNPASAGLNNDKYIRTNFMEAGLQYMFTRNWGTMLEVPYWVRNYKGAYEGNNDDIHWYDNNSIGDIRIWGMYTGLSEDMSTGLLLGLKVPSGDWHYPPFDRDTQIGSGSTDILFQGYHLGTLPSELGRVPLTFRGRPFNWFVQALYDLPLWQQDDYMPGREFDGALGGYYNFGHVGMLNEVAPMLTFLWSDRTRDDGANADHDDSGYTRVVVAPGGEIRFGSVRAYGDIEVPIFQNMNGYQVTTPWATKLILSYSF
jgi:hypothetical protein